ncbi:Potassium voltage-gated channel protein eag [Porphyridium purpureum]|uniref:Potassium voltage-gated channel protein eag n=1 Tax=Porphyridium purpureum TaxID=35688 RepID=A0A5J4YMX2_PORPP|nr:Potassium voltage-gated channel protein eag [Porphyridium purpureum]|eukprot:POR4031..scf295_9
MDDDDASSARNLDWQHNTGLSVTQRDWELLNETWHTHDAAREQTFLRTKFSHASLSLKDVQKQASSQNSGVRDGARTSRREKWKQRMLPFAISPFSLRRRVWDVLILCLMVFLSTVYVFEVCFSAANSISSPVIWIGIPISVLFFVDLVLNFFTGYVRLDGIVETDLDVVAKHYLRSWFMIDLIAAIPWSLIAFAGEPSSFPTVYSIPAMLHLVKMLKAEKVARHFQMEEKVTWLEVRFKINQALVKIVSVLCLVSLVVHWIACLFYFAAVVQPLGTATWVTEFGGIEWKQVSLWIYYEVALYFSVYTVTTIGLGDIFPVSVNERIYVIVAMFCGAAIWALILSSLSGLVAEMSADVIHHRLLLDCLPRFAKLRSVPFDVHLNIRKYLVKRSLAHYFTRDEHVLNAMSPELRAEVHLFVLGDSIRKFFFFHDAPEAIIKALCAFTEEETFTPNETVLRLREPHDKIYVVNQGKLLRRWGGKGGDGRAGLGRAPEEVLRPGDVFGDQGIIAGRKREYDVVSLDYSSVYSFKRSKVLELLEQEKAIFYEMEKHEGLCLWAHVVHVLQPKVRMLKLSRKLLEIAPINDTVVARQLAKSLKETAILRKRQKNHYQLVMKQLNEFEAKLNIAKQWVLLQRQLKKAQLEEEEGQGRGPGNESDSRSLTEGTGRSDAST